MKVFLFCCLILSGIAGCRKKCPAGTMVIKDCTGTYLRYEGKDHPVCNPSVLLDYEDSATVKATYRKAGAGKCEAKDDIHCMMVHPYERGDWIVVTRVY